MWHSDLLAGRERWRVEQADCILGMADLPAGCIDLCVTSPPFPTLYAYSSEPGDIGNSEDLAGEAPLHLSYFYRALARVLRPGRAAVIHVCQIPRLKRAGGQGLFDFRGLNIRLGERAGLIYTYDWLIRKNPQAQAIRSRSRELQFAGLESDRARSRGSLGDYLIKFTAPGDNAAPVSAPEQVTRNDWIQWAEACWTDIKETDTLNVAEGREEKDTKHICPLQLSVYERCVRLFSDPGDLVLDPFAGIGSCGYTCLGGASPSTGRRVHDPRRFVGFELKGSYHAAAVKNCQRAERQHRAEQRDLFAAAAAHEEAADA